MSAAWHTQTPDRSGLSAFTVLIRGPEDPQRSPRRKGTDPTAWKKKVRKGTPEEWADKIVELLSDGAPRTFNAITVELADTTADVAFQEQPEKGLWLAVDRGDLELTYEAPILFRARRAIMTNETTTMDEFCARESIRIACEATAPPPDDDWPAGAFHWKVTLRHKGRKLTTEFHQGSAHTCEPTAADVLSCLVSDAVSVESEGSFEDWADSLGYDTDSRKAERTYKACVRIRDRVRRFLPDHDLYDLANLEH